MELQRSLEQQHGIYLGFFFFTKAQHGQKAAELFFFILQGKLVLKIECPAFGGKIRQEIFLELESR